MINIERTLNSILNILTGITRAGLPVRNTTATGGTTIQNIDVTTPPTLNQYTITNLDELNETKYYQFSSFTRNKQFIQKTTPTTVTYSVGPLSSLSSSWTNRASLTYVNTPDL